MHNTAPPAMPVRAEHRCAEPGRMSSLACSSHCAIARDAGPLDGLLEHPDVLLEDLWSSLLAGLCADERSDTRAPNRVINPGLPDASATGSQESAQRLEHNRCAQRCVITRHRPLSPPQVGLPPAQLRFIATAGSICGAGAFAAAACPRSPGRRPAESRQVAGPIYRLPPEMR